jgi:hypothetical protein
MSYLIPQSEPKSVLQNTTAIWQRVLSEYPASSWSLNYTLIGPTRINIAGGANGSTHEVNVNVATTANWNAGNYEVFARVSDGTQVFAVTPTYATLEVVADPLAVTVPTSDVRSWAAQTLETVETAIKSLAAKTVSSATVNGTTYTLADMDALMRLRTSLRAEVVNEDAAANPNSRLIYARFSAPL